MIMRIEQIAQVMHETNRAFCEILGDNSQLPWKEAGEEAQKASISQVEFLLKNPHAPQSHSHVLWMNDKLSAGWKYGEKKNKELKLHPDLVPYENLSPTARIKDALVQAVVKGMISE